MLPNIERNLYLTTQLLELGIPTVIALNMMDEVKAHGDEIDIANLEKQMGLPIVPITATKSHGIKELMERAITLAKRPESVKKTALEGTKIFDSVKNISDALKKGGYTDTLYHAVKLLEKDDIIKEGLKLNQPLEAAISKIISEEEKRSEEEPETVIADLRYRYISKIVSKHVKKGRQEGTLSLSDKIDNIVTNRVLGMPIFFLIMFTIFQISVGSIGALLKDPVSLLV